MAFQNSITGWGPNVSPVRKHFTFKLEVNGKQVVLRREKECTDGMDPWSALGQQRQDQIEDQHGRLWAARLLIGVYSKHQTILSVQGAAPHPTGLRTP